MQTTNLYLKNSLQEVKNLFLGLKSKIDTVFAECYHRLCYSLIQGIEGFQAEDYPEIFDDEIDKGTTIDYCLDESCKQLVSAFEENLNCFVDDKITQLIHNFESEKILNFIMGELDVKNTIVYQSKKGCIGYALADIAPWDLFAIGTNEGNIYCYDSSTFNLVSEYENAHSGWIMSMCYVENQNLLLSTSRDKTIKVFSVQDKALLLITTLKTHNDSVNGIFVIPRRNMFISFGRDNEIKLWDLFSLLEIGSINTDEGKMGCQACFVEELSSCGIGFYNGNIKFYNIFTKSHVLTLPVNNSGYYINSILYDSKSQRLICQANSTTIKIWKFHKNTFEPEKEIKVKGHANYFILHENILLTCCDQSNIEVWDIDKSIKCKEIELPSSMKNSNGILLMNRSNTKYLVVSSWNVNKLVIFKMK